MSRWKNRSEVYIPPLTRKGFPEKILIRDKIDPVLFQQDDEKTVFLVQNEKQEESDATVLLVRDIEPQGYLKRVKTGEIVKIASLPFVLGKGESSDYVISENRAVSRKHARIYRKANQFFLEDMGSLNHSYVGEEMIQKAIELTDNLVFKLADEEFQFLCKVEKDE